MPTIRGVTRLSLKNFLVLTDFSVASPAALPFAPRPAANIVHMFAIKVGGRELIGPILMGMSRPVHVLQRPRLSKLSSTWPPSPLLMLRKTIRTLPCIQVSVEAELVGEE